MFLVLVTVASCLAAIIASICGFGIGSVITPVLSLKFEMGLAVAFVSIPHFVATLIRAWKLKSHIDWQFLKQFGIASALGSLLGALLAHSIPGLLQAITLASLMLFVGSLGLSGKTKDFIIPKRLLLVAGTFSGLLGGLVGNQGGVRSAALLSTDLKKDEFVATATTTGVIVDLARMPVYLGAYHTQIKEQIPLISLITISCVVGTFLGIPFLKLIPEKTFRTCVYILILALGLFVSVRILSGSYGYL